MSKIRYFPFYTSFVKLGLNTCQIAYLSELIYLHTKFSSEDGCFYRKVSQITEMTALSKYQQQGIRRELKIKGFLRYKRKAKNIYSFWLNIAYINNIFSEVKTLDS